jgi:hypothetical protein
MRMCAMRSRDALAGVRMALIRGFVTDFPRNDFFCVSAPEKPRNRIFSRIDSQTALSVDPPRTTNPQPELRIGEDNFADT